MDHAREQDLDMLGHRLGEQRRECYYQAHKLAGHSGTPLTFFLVETVSSLRALRFLFKDQKWIKSSLEMSTFDDTQVC